MGPRVLLVEDEALVALIAEEALGGFGLDVVTVSSGQQALAAFTDGAFDLAIVDIGLPDMEGDDLTLRLRETNPGLPLLIASGYPLENQARFGPAPFGFVAKPYTEGDLARAIRSLGFDVTA